MAHETRPAILFAEEGGGDKTPVFERLAMYPSYKAAYEAVERLSKWMLDHGYDVAGPLTGWTIAQWAGTTVDGVIELLEQLPTLAKKE